MASERRTPEWALIYEEPGMLPEFFTDQSSALRQLERRRFNWECHMFRLFDPAAVHPDTERLDWWIAKGHRGGMLLQQGPVDNPEPEEVAAMGKWQWETTEFGNEYYDSPRAAIDAARSTEKGPEA